MLGGSSRRVVRLAILVLLVFGGVLSMVASSLPAYALFSGCRNDPIVTLSDGTKLHITLYIDTQPSKVQDVHYVVHGPGGTRITKIQFIGKPPLPERVDFQDDSDDGEYRVDVQVQISDEPAATVLDVKAPHDRAIDVGVTGRWLHTTLNP